MTSTSDDTYILAGGTVARTDGSLILRRESVVVRNGEIAFVGDDESARRRFPQARVVDSSGTTILPGLVDAHAHMIGLGDLLENVQLEGTASFDEVVRLIAERARITPAGEWVTGRGWDQNDWPVKEFPTAVAMDAAVTDHPVWIRRIDGHAGLANSVTMRLAGIDANTPDPAGGRILRDPSGRPTGVFIDNAMDLITTKLPVPSPEKRMRQLKKAAEVIAATGLTAVHEAGADNESIDALKRLADAGELPIRVYVMLADDDRLLEQWFASGPLLDYADRITVRAVKMYADGALGSRGAALLAPYSDDHDNEGLMLTTSERLTAVARRARKAGFQVCTHAIGDRGTRVVLDSYEAADVQPRDRFRIEHLQVAAPGDFERLAARGIIASMQPTHATSDMPWAEARLGSERIKGAYAWRTVLHVGAPLAFGSDFPIEQVNPFLGFQAAVHRQDVNGHPPGGWYPSERLSLGETLAGFTSGANYASFTEKVLGDVAPGRKADLTVIEGEGFPPELAKTTVRYTIVSGKIVYDSSTRPRSMSSK